MTAPHESPVLTRESMHIEDGLPLEASGGDIEALRSNIQHLMDIEAIKQLKHAYFRCLDTANLTELESLLHPDLYVEFVGGSYHWLFEGRAAYVDAIARAFTRRTIGQHNGHSPEIQVLSASEANGIWYMADHMWVLDHQHLTKGTALYYDRYCKIDGRWLICETRYRRLYEMHESLAKNPQLAAHYLADHGRPTAK